MQATADEISAIIGGKMPHVQTSIPGGTAWYPSVEKLDDILFRAKKLKDWVDNVMIPDAIAIASVYLNDVATIGNNKHGNFMAYGVFDRPSRELEDRFFPAGIVRMKSGARFSSHSMVPTSPRARRMPTTRTAASRCIPRLA